MEYQEIKKLLDRYFEGNSSLEEERLLRRYFSGSEVDERLKEYSPMFRFFRQQQTAALSEAKAAELLRTIPQVSAKRLPLRSRAGMWVLRVAAMLLIAVGMWWAYQEQTAGTETASVDWSKYEITNEEEALRITRGALFQVSKTLNEGANTAAGKLDKMQEIGKFFK